jgi:hypothetical protein
MHSFPDDLSASFVGMRLYGGSFKTLANMAMGKTERKKVLITEQENQVQAAIENF